MRILKGIRYPQRGEHLLAIDPEMQPDTLVDWRRRLNFFTGRSLSHVALETEQTVREARLALRGQSVSHGVIEGLSIGLERSAAGDFLHLNPGTGITPYGEDVTIPQPLRVPLHTPQVYIPPETGLGSGHAELSLGEMIAGGEADPLPRAGILVLEPVTIPFSAEADSTDPCEIDEQNDAFDDWQWVDGAALTLCIWPINRMALPPFDADQWRNLLAHAIFEAERTRDPHEVLPWEQIGVSVGLVGFDINWNALFVDRYAVVRAGGKPRRRTPLIPDVGNPFLWQARLQHFSEYMADLTLDEMPIDQIRTRVRYLPPAGILPLEAIRPRVVADDGSTSVENRFFAPGYVIEAIPVVLEQLDVVLEASASLEPFDLSVPDRVRVAVPVPQMWFEPNLLQVEHISDEFQEAVDEFTLRRNRWLGRREEVRAIASTLIETITGEVATYPDPDPNAVGGETVLVGDDLIDEDDPALAEPEETYGTQLSDGNRVVEVVEELRTYLASEQSPLRAFAQVDIDVPFGDMDAGSIPGLSAVPVDDGENMRLVYRLVMSEETRDELANLLMALPDMPADTAAEAAEELFRESQRNEVGRLDELGLRKFIDFLQDRVAEADDRIDLGFVQAQTNIYRLRQLMLGNVAASRLATSPALSEIAKGDTAAATREDVRRYLDNVVKSGELRSLQGDTGATPTTPTRAGATPSSGDIAQPITRGSVGLSGISRSTGTISPRLFFSEEFAGGFDVSTVGGTVSPGGTVIAPMPGTGTTVPTGGELLLDLEQLQAVPEVQAAVSRGTLFGAQGVITADEAIVDQAYLTGKAYDFRTMTVAERLKLPEANESKEATVSAKYEAAASFGSLLELGLNLDDIEVPGVAVYDESGAPVFDTIDLGGDVTKRVLRRERRSLADLYGTGFVDLLRDPDPADADEADFFSLAVQQSEHTVALLRLVEGRIRDYKAAIARCQRTLNTVNQFASSADRRLKVIGEELAEARHDVAVAVALRDEEAARIDAINERRDQIINTHVDFLAFYRPRLGDNRQDMPVRIVDNGLVPAPVPACLARRVYIVPELRDMVNLLRDVPLKWLTDMKPLLNRLDRVDMMVDTIVTARNRAQVYTQVLAGQPTRHITDGRTVFAQSLNSVYSAQRDVISRYRVNTARLDLSRQTVGGSWQNTRVTAEENVTLSDLIDAGHGRSDIVDQGTTAFNRVMHVAACLYNEFAAVLPSLRLDWAERLSQYDAPVNLRNLSALPRWGEIDRLERRDMQEMVDWLFQRVDQQQEDAVDFMNDLVRVCILLASHAPVKEIISGSIEETTTASVGSRVRVKIDPFKTRVGMGALLFQGNSVVAQALVDDVAGSVASVRVVKTMQPTVQLAADARVQLAEPEALAINPQTSQAIYTLPTGLSTVSRQG